MSSAKAWAGRDRLAPGTIGVIGTRRSPTGAGWEANGRARRLDGSYIRTKMHRATEQAAREAARENLARRLGAVGVTAGVLTPDSPFGDLLQAWADEEERTAENAPQTRVQQHRSAQRNLLSVLGGLSIREITVPVCEQAYADLLLPRRGRGQAAELPADAIARARSGETDSDDEGVVHATQARQDLITLRKIMQKAVRLGLRPDNPAQHVKLQRKRNREIKFLDADGYQAIREAVAAYRDRPGRMGKRPSRDLGDAMDITLGLGLRIGETLGIRIEDIDLSTRPTLTVTIRGTVVEAVGIPKHYQPWTKTKKNHRVAAPEWVDAIIRERMAESPADATFLFQTSTGAPLGTHELRRSWRIVRTWANIPEHVVPHVLRKSAVTHTSQEVGIEAASRLAAHGDLRTTQMVYDGSDLVPYGITRSMELFDPSRPREEREFERIVRPIAEEDEDFRLRATVESVLESIGMLPDALTGDARTAIIDAQVARTKDAARTRRA